MTKKFGLLITVTICFFVGGMQVFAESSSTNYKSNINNTQNSSEYSNSSNYNIDCQQVGDTAIGNSNSSHYQLIHGVVCSRNFNLTIGIRCLPANRYLGNGNNWSNHVMVEVRPTGGDINSILFSQEVITNNDGIYQGLVLSGINPGIYDITCKGWNTLRLKEASVDLSTGVFIDFSHGGTIFALVGDVDPYNEGYRNNSQEFGDNEINIADYSILVSRFNNPPSSAEERYDLDKYGGNVSVADYSILVFNYNNKGE